VSKEPPRRPELPVQGQLAQRPQEQGVPVVGEAVPTQEQRDIIQSALEIANRYTLSIRGYQDPEPVGRVNGFFTLFRQYVGQYMPAELFTAVNENEALIKELAKLRPDYRVSFIESILGDIGMSLSRAIRLSGRTPGGVYREIKRSYGGAAPKAEPKAPSGVAVAAEALKPVREAIQKGIGDALYGKSDDPRKQKKGLLGISEEDKAESQKKVMKNIVVPIVKTAAALKTNTEDIANMIFNPDKYDEDMTERRIKRIKAEEAKAGIVRDKTNPMIIIRKPRGFWTAETSDPKEEAYNQKRAAWRGADNVFYVRVPNPIFAAKLRPSFKEFADAGVKLWTGVQQNDPKRSEDVDGTLKSLHDDEFIFIPEARAKEIYGSLRQFVADKQDEGFAEGYEDEGWTKGELKRFAKIDPRTLKGQDLVDYKQDKLALDRAMTQNAKEKVEKDIKAEEAKATPDQAKLAKMREAKGRVEKRQQDLVLRGQQEFKDTMMFQAAEKAKRDAEYYAQQQAAAAEQTQQTEEVSDAVKEQAQGSVDLLQQAQVVGGAKPTNPALYAKAKAIADKTYSKPSAYKSGFIVKKYKEMGGEYEDEPDGKRPLERWFKEDWKDVGNKEYPVYRPTKRISKDTPLTPDEIDPENLKLQIKEKQKIRGDRNLSAFEKRGGADPNPEDRKKRGRDEPKDDDDDDDFEIRFNPGGMAAEDEELPEDDFYCSVCDRFIQQGTADWDERDRVNGEDYCGLCRRELFEADDAIFPDEEDDDEEDDDDEEEEDDEEARVRRLLKGMKEPFFRGGAGSDDEEEEEEVRYVEVKVGKILYWVDADPRREPLPVGNYKTAKANIFFKNRRIFDPETQEEIGHLGDTVWKKVAMAVLKKEEAQQKANLKRMGVAMDEDTDEDTDANGGAKPVEMKQSDYYKEHKNIVKLLKNTGKSLLSEAKDQQEEASTMAKKMDAPDPFADAEMVGSGAVEYTLQKAGKPLFNPSGDMSKAGRQSFTPDYDAYGATVQEGRQNAFNLSRSMYDQSKAIELPDFKLIKDDTSLRFYRKDDENVVLVGIRGTDVKSWKDLYTWAVIGANQDLRMTTRFQDDLAKLVSFQRNYPPSQFYYVATGSSLAGSIADRFLEMGLIEEAITYNPSIEKKYVLDEGVLNHRVYLDTDPLFLLMGQYAPNTEIRVNPNKTNFYNPSKEKDYLIASHSIYPIYNPAFEGGGMEGSGKTYTLEEWKAIFDAKLEEKRKAIEAREAKKKQTAKAKRERAKARRDGRDEPPPLETPFRTSRVQKATPPKEREREPEPEEEEPEVEVAEYRIEGKVYLVEEDDGETDFADRRVFDDDNEELGNLGMKSLHDILPKTHGKKLVDAVMKQEKRGKYASADKPKSSSESLPSFESKQPKSPKAPASARVELREELVAEQPRNPAGEFAVAVAQPRPMTALPRMTAKQKEFFMNLLSRNVSATQKSILLARSGMSDKLIERLLPFITPTNRRDVMKQTGMITERVAEKRTDTNYPHLPADIKTGLRKLAQDIMNMKGRRPTMLDDARRTDTLKKMTETEKRQMLRRNFVAGVKTCEAIVSMTRTDMFGDYSCRRWEAGEPSYFKRVETSEYGVKGKCMAIGDDAGMPQGATLDQLKPVVGVGRDNAMMSSRMLAELSPSTWGVEDKPEPKFLSKGVPITKSTPDTDLAQHIRETQKVWRICILKMFDSCGIKAAIQKKIEQSWKRGYGVVIFWDALQGEGKLSKAKVREAQQETDEKLSSPKLRDFLLDLRGFCAMVAEDTEAEDEAEGAKRRKDEEERILMRRMESEMTPDEEEERAKVLANPELKAKLWEAVRKNQRQLDSAFDTTPFSGDLRQRINRMKRIAGIDYNTGYGSIVPANIWSSPLRAKLPPIRKKDGYYPSVEEYIRDMEKRGRGMKGGARPRLSGPPQPLGQFEDRKAEWNKPIDFGPDQGAVDAHAATVPVPDVSVLIADQSLVGSPDTMNTGQLKMRMLKRRLPGQIRGDMYYDDNYNRVNWDAFANYHYQQLQLLRHLENMFPEDPTRVMNIHERWSAEARRAGDFGSPDFQYMM